MDFYVLRLMVTVCVPIMEASSFFNFPGCGDCSSREDVPCRIQRIDNRCYHTEFRDKWPGKPRDLTSKEIELASGRTSASFTWKPPYDASFESLSGFFLTVNIWFSMSMGSLGPFCFHANLSGTDWSSVKEPHSVLFHFDCVTTTPNKEMHVSLDVSSSPMPNQNPGYVETRTVIGHIPTQHTNRFVRSVIGWRKNTKPEIEDLKINYTVAGTSVNVKFGPLMKGVQYYMVCLSACRTEFINCSEKKKISEFGVREIVFEDVKPDNYSILIRRNIESKFFRTNCFPVVGAKPKAENSPVILSIITLGCLLFVVIATTVLFFFLRRYKRCVPGCLEKCKINSPYEQTSQTLPNNTTDCPEGTSQELWFLFSTKHKSFITVARKLATIVNKWTKSTVDINETICETDQDVQTKMKNFSHHKVVIILSEDTKRQLENIQNDSVWPEEGLTSQEKFLCQTFRRLLSEQRQGESLVSVCSITLNIKAFEDFETYHLMNTTKGIDNLKIDGKELVRFINTLSPIEKGLPEDFAQSSETAAFLSSVKVYMEERKLSSISDHGYGSGSHEDIHFNSQNKMAAYRSEINHHVLNPKLEREEDTKHWIQSQSVQMKPIVPPPMPHIRAPSYISTHYQRSQPQHCYDKNKDGYTRVRVNYENPHSNYFYPPEYEQVEKERKHHVQHQPQWCDNQTEQPDWEGPDSDSESVTMSTILQQGIELNRNYMINIKEC